MESLGQKLREAREQNNYSLEQVARDTHISKQYLRSLEEEDFASLPGETYVIGFLRNYAEYLSLNPDEIVTLYRNIRIQEQPLPMSELLEGGTRRGRGKLLIVLLVLAVIGVGAYLLYRFVFSTSSGEPAPAREAATLNPPSGQEYVLTEEALTRWFNLEDTISVPLANRSYSLVLTDISDRLTLKIPGGTVELRIGQDRRLDLDGDGTVDLRMLCNDLDLSGSVKRANIGLYKETRGRLVQAPAAQPSTGDARSDGSLPRPQTAENTLPGEAGTTTPTGPTVQPTAVSPAPIAASTVGPVQVATAENPSPFRVSITFRDFCLFRYLLDGETRDERFFHKGETFSLDVKNNVRLWISNAGALRLMVAGREVEAGKPGEVVTRVIQWTDQGGSYALEVLSTP